MTRPFVVNKRQGPVSNAVYIGRPSKWGNPFSHLPNTLAKYRVASRAEAIEKYREWVTQQPDLMASLPELEGKTLVCWCKPASCHGDVLADLVQAQSK